MTTRSPPLHRHGTVARRMAAPTDQARRTWQGREESCIGGTGLPGGAWAASRTAAIAAATSLARRHTPRRGQHQHDGNQPPWRWTTNVRRQRWTGEWNAPTVGAWLGFTGPVTRASGPANRRWLGNQRPAGAHSQDQAPQRNAGGQVRPRFVFKGVDLLKTLMRLETSSSDQLL